VARSRGLLTGFPNSADLGGLPLPGGPVLPEKRIVRSDTPPRLTPSEQEAADSWGFRAVLDLRSVDEVLASPHPLRRSLGYATLPLIDPVAEQREDFSRVTTLGEIYRSSLQRNARHIALIFSALADAPQGPVLVSCRAGRDRTGMVVALLLDLAGVDRAVVAEDYALAPADASGHRRRGGSDILTMLDQVTSAYGSTSAYLRWLGLSDSHVSAIRERLEP